jgi:hypothetical protein
LQRRFAKSDLHACEARPRKDYRGVDLISDALPFGRLWYTKPDDAIGTATENSKSAVVLALDVALANEVNAAT